jgi:hypothetical protein
VIHTGRGRSRGEQKLDRDKCYKGMADGKASEKARKAYRHKPYTVSDYLKKVGIDVTKGVDAGGAYDQRTASSVSEQ